MTARGFYTHLDERLEHRAHVGRVTTDARRELAVGPGARAALAERKVRLAVQLAAVHERADSAASHTYIPARPDPSETRRDAPKKSPTETRRRAGQCGLRGARDGAVRTMALSRGAHRGAGAGSGGGGTRRTALGETQTRTTVREKRDDGDDTTTVQTTRRAARPARRARARLRARRRARPAFQRRGRLGPQRCKAGRQT